MELVADIVIVHSSIPVLFYTVTVVPSKKTSLLFYIFKPHVLCNNDAKTCTIYSDDVGYNSVQVCCN